MRKTTLPLLAALLALIGNVSACGESNPPVVVTYDPAIFDTERITICESNHRYWQYRRKPVMLIGGSVEDNLFQAPEVEEQLRLLHSVGGNYVRCTMSGRDPGNVWPFAGENGQYNLNEPNPEYWLRFDRFLKVCEELDIIVQIEVWATFDFYRENWDRNPFNPANNGQYTAEASGLPEKVATHPTFTDNPFFWSVPAEHNNTTVLQYQQKFVDTLLSYSLKYPNVLYCMDNETSVTPKWGAYWSEYIKEAAKKEGVVVHTTEMWDAHKLSDSQHKNTIHRPDIYSFVDVSQNNHQTGQTHWDNGQWVRGRISGPVRPLNNVKIYGGPREKYGTPEDGVERFWRNLIGGMASARFHRPESGIGLNETARQNLKSARMLLNAMDIFTGEPARGRLTGRDANEAYYTASNREAAVYFPAAGEVTLDTTAMTGQLKLRWLNITTSEWGETTTHPAGQPLKLKTPGDGPWVALVRGG